MLSQRLLHLQFSNITTQESTTSSKDFFDAKYLSVIFPARLKNIHWCLQRKCADRHRPITNMPQCPSQCCKSQHAKSLRVRCAGDAEQRQRKKPTILAITDDKRRWNCCARKRNHIQTTPIHSIASIGRKRQMPLSSSLPEYSFDQQF